MELSYMKGLPQGGFDFSNCLRNQAMANNGMAPIQQKFTKTGTTIVGLVYKDGVCLAADTRATGGSIVGDKNCEKIHYLAPNIFTCGAGTAADCDHVTEMIRRQLELHRLNTHTQNRVQMAAQLLCSNAFKYGGHVGTHLICGGFDCKGPQLIECQHDGNQFALPYLTTGSGSLAAMAIFESEYKDGLTEQEAINLCVKAIEAGIYHDLGSGSNVDVRIVTKEGSKMFRNLKHDNYKMFSKPDGFKLKPDRIKVIDEFRQKLVIEAGDQPMELA